MNTTIAPNLAAIYSIISGYEQVKKRSYNNSVLAVDQGSFTPLVFSCFGGMSRECSIFCKILAEKIAKKRTIDYSLAMNWIKTRLNFHLLRSCMLSSRDSPSQFHRDDVQTIEAKFVATGSKLLVQE